MWVEGLRVGVQQQGEGAEKQHEGCDDGVEQPGAAEVAGGVGIGHKEHEGDGQDGVDGEVGDDVSPSACCCDDQGVLQAVQDGVDEGEAEEQRQHGQELLPQA